MAAWILDLPLGWVVVVTFALTYLVSLAIHGLVLILAKGDRPRGFEGVSPGMLPPLGIIFGLFVAFLASQVWSDMDRAPVNWVKWLALWLQAICTLVAIAMVHIDNRGAAAAARFPSHPLRCSRSCRRTRPPRTRSITRFFSV
jgi:hypothetical protein